MTVLDIEKMQEIKVEKGKSCMFGCCGHKCIADVQRVQVVGYKILYF